MSQSFNVEDGLAGNNGGWASKGENVDAARRGGKTMSEPTGSVTHSTMDASLGRGGEWVMWNRSCTSGATSPGSCMLTGHL